MKYKTYNIKNRNNKYSLKNKGFTLIEIVIYVGILSLILLLIGSVILYFTQSNSQAKGDREVLESARRALEEITYEINAAKGIYTPTTTANQLSLETSKYLPTGETTTYIDFFLCGLRICLKKESQNPTYLTQDTVQVSNLTFNQISTNDSTSIRINLTVTYKDTINNVQPSVSLTSTATLRDN